MKKERSPQKVVKNLKLMREELKRWNYDFVRKEMVRKIDTCLYGEYTLIRSEENDNNDQE